MFSVPDTVLIVGAARNCAKALRDTYQTLETAFSGFSNRKWFVVESDSSDKTAEVLGSLASSSKNFEFVSLGNLRDQIPSRTERIAHCRNVYLERVRSDTCLPTDAIMAVADLDGINDLLNQNAVASCFTRDYWSVCTANQLGPYYDIYALRHETWCADDWWTQYTFARNLGISERESTRFACHSKMLHIPAEAPWISVRSAFGGLALYRRSVLLNSAAVYAGSNKNGVGVCEHVPLHSCLTSAGEKIFINPRLINADFTEHSRELLGRRQALEHVRSLAKILVFQAKGLVGFR